MSTSRVTTKETLTNPAHQRLSLLKLAHELEHVSGAWCWKEKHQNSGYDWKHRFHTHGFSGLKVLFDCASFRSSDRST